MTPMFSRDFVSSKYEGNTAGNGARSYVVVVVVVVVIFLLQSGCL